MASTPARRGTRKAPSRATSAARAVEAAGETATFDLGPGVFQEFARLAQREMRASEEAVARWLQNGADVWASGHDPEGLPTLAVALSCVEEACVGEASAEEGQEDSIAQRPILFLSPEAELLRARQLRFGARATTWLIDAAGAPQELEKTLSAISGRGVIWCTLESLRLPQVRDCLAERAPRAFVIESAHAASPLAHEMRPSLALVPGLRTACGNPPVLAFSRAASVAVREDAVARLGLVSPRLECAPLLADSTRITVVSRGGARSKQASVDLVELVDRLPRPTIVFCSTPQEADAVFGQLVAAQVPVHRYHGGMSVTERATEMLHFTLPGRRAVMVATSAFRPDSGLAGIDAGNTATPEGLGLGFIKQRARSLVHFGAPASLDQYAHELAVLGGEEETETVLFLEPEHIELNRALLDQLRLTGEEIDLLGRMLSVAEAPLQVSALEASTGLGRRAVQRGLRLLADAGVAEVSETGVARTVSSEALLQVTALLVNVLGQMRAADQERLGALHAFLHTEECRRTFLEAYWGRADEELRTCGRCDVCLTNVNAGAKPASRGAQVEPLVSRRRAPARSWMAGVPQPETATVVVQQARRQAASRAR